MSPAEGGGLPVTFARMRRRHLDQVVALDAGRPDSSWTRRTFLDELAGNNRHYVVGGIEGQEVVAFAGLLVIADEGHVTTLVVAPRFRRSGVATALLAELTAAAVHADCSGMTLEVSDRNEGAVALYEARGFTVEGRRLGYYPDGSDALVMWNRSLVEPSRRAS